MRSLSTNETLIVGVVIDVYKKTVFPDRFKVIFKGKTEVQRGRYTWWYPVKHVAYARLVNELKLRYGCATKYGVMGTMEL